MPGIDENIWNPEKDKFIPANFSDKNMKGKLRVRNTKEGAKFAIFVPKDSSIKDINYEFV